MRLSTRTTGVASASGAQVLKRIARSFGYAGEGIAAVSRTQPNFWIHIAVATLALALAVLLQLGPLHLAVIFAMIGLVLAMEALNTAVEALGDAVTTEYALPIKRAKDAAAGGVLLAAMASVAVGLVILGPPLLARLGPR